MKNNTYTQLMILSIFIYGAIATLIASIIYHYKWFGVDVLQLLLLIAFMVLQFKINTEKFKCKNNN